MKIHEVVQKAMLDNSTKDEMYNDICDKLNCSRHAAKVLVHCFIWECSERYMEHMLKKEMGVQEPIVKKHPLLTGWQYDIREVETGLLVGNGTVVTIFSDGSYTILLKNPTKEFARLDMNLFKVAEDDFIYSPENAYKPIFRVCREESAK